MRIAVDAMGGDYAPNEIVRGAALFMREYPGVSILLTGDENLLKKVCAKAGISNSNLPEIVHTTECVSMGESPLRALKEKKNSSIVKAVEAIENGEAEALVSFGNTGVTVAAVTLKLGLLKGVSRAGIAAPFPSKTGRSVVIDVGANTTFNPHHLVGYALMASRYCEEVYHIRNPRVGMLNVGEEIGKGHRTAKATFKELEKVDINYCGNAEGDDIFKGGFDVIVCDGFTGNAILKTSEGLAIELMDLLRKSLMSSLRYKLGAILCKPAFSSMVNKMDAKEYGGAPLLGVNGICIIGHGKSDARAVYNALKVASEAATNKLNTKILTSIEAYRSDG